MDRRNRARNRQQTQRRAVAAVSRKRVTLLGTKLNGQSVTLPPDLQKLVSESLESWRRDGNVRRLWVGDARLWTGSDEAEWLGWLTVVDEEQKNIDDILRVDDFYLGQTFSHVLLLG